MTIVAPSAESTFALTLEQFVKKAEDFLQNYYAGGNDDETMRGMVKAIKELHLEIDEEAIEAEFELHCDRKDLEADYYDSAWF